MNIVIVGHVDHGKSTFTGRLLFDTNSLPESVIEEAKRSSKRPDGSLEFAYLLDSFEEERAKNITIDTSRTFFSSKKRRYTIIDAPGHVEFLKNMITGASQAEAAILIVAVSRGVEEQTKRHAFVLKLLGIERIIVAVNKLDLVEFDESKFNKMASDISAFLSSLEITPAAVVPLSAMQGDNLYLRSKNTPWYKGPTVIEALDAGKEKRDLSEEAVRIVVQSVFDKNGQKLVFGRVEAGKITPGQKLQVMPSEENITIQSIEVLEGKLQEAAAGKSLALIVDNPNIIKRGSILCDEKKPKVTNTFKSSIFCLSPLGISRGKTFTLKCATQATPCRIIDINQKMNSSSLESTGQNAQNLNETEVGEVIIESENPIAVEDFSNVPALGRFVLQDHEQICGAGIIREL